MVTLPLPSPAAPTVDVDVEILPYKGADCVSWQGTLTAFGGCFPVLAFPLLVSCDAPGPSLDEGTYWMTVEGDGVAWQGFITVT